MVLPIITKFGKFNSNPHLLKLTPTLQQTLLSPSQWLVVKQILFVM